jgi:hypothetical protein
MAMQCLHCIIACVVVSSLGFLHHHDCVLDTQKMCLMSVLMRSILAINHGLIRKLLIMEDRPYFCLQCNTAEFHNYMMQGPT